MSEQLNREAAAEAIMYLQLKPHELASIVDEVLTAALGDEPLYRRSKGPCVHGLYVPHRHVLPIQGREEQCEGGRFVQVNPEGEQR